MDVIKLHAQDIGELIFIASWCNGSTKDFGSFSTGSTPVTTTNKYDVPQVEVINTFACGILY